MSDDLVEEMNRIQTRADFCAWLLKVADEIRANPECENPGLEDFLAAMYFSCEGVPMDGLGQSWSQFADIFYGGTVYEV